VQLGVYPRPRRASLPAASPTTSRLRTTNLALSKATSLTPDNFATLYVGANLFNASGRGFPDVAAYGENVTIITGGQLAPVAGTSCATPIFASVIALLNDRLIAAGRSPLGFLNPWLYANAHGLTDITDGSNPGCGTMGFPAAVGWDPVTGLGSPNFDSLLATLGLSS
jgi:tripeptidyl-peptidase-1